MQTFYLAAAILPALAWAQSASTITATPVPGATATQVSPSQSAAISSALLSYASSLRHAPFVTPIGAQLIYYNDNFNLNMITDLLPVPTGNGIDWASFATAPPDITSEPTWLATQHSTLSSSITSIQRSVLNEAVNIVRSQLSLGSTTIAAVRTATSDALQETGTNAAAVPARLGAAEGVLGAAAMGVGLLAAAL